MGRLISKCEIFLTAVFCCKGLRRNCQNFLVEYKVKQDGKSQKIKYAIVTEPTTQTCQKKITRRQMYLIYLRSETSKIHLNFHEKKLHANVKPGEVVYYG